MDRLPSPFPFLEAIESLRALKNSRWALYSSPESDSLYEQMYQMALVCLAHPDLSGEEEANAVVMCMVHDVGHIAAGEVTLRALPSNGAVEEEIGLKHLSYLLKESSPALAERLPEALVEYQNGETRVARLIRQVGKFESLHQAVIRRKRGLGVRGTDDLDAMRESITDPWLAKQADEITADDWDALDETVGSKAPTIFVIGESAPVEIMQRVAKEFDMEYVSVDELLREEQNRPGSIFGRFIKETIDSFTNIPPSLAVMLIKSKVKGAQSMGKGILVRGFPQCVRQVVAFELEISNVYSTIYLEYPVEKMMERARMDEDALKRGGDVSTGERKNLEATENSRQALVDHVSKNFFHKVDATGSTDEVYAAIRDIIKKITEQ
ncbi:adenylate kinase [Ilyonectria sp. MPI-CAGE-AT-0026]|nr:adenylate kinase [Ilyonectria sp. MPI-CAGE-AT-0026]